MNAAIRLIRRDLKTAWRHSAGALAAIAFFVLCATMFPFAVGPDPEILARIAPGIIWVSALLASLLSLEPLWQQDFADGTVDALLTTPMPPETICFCRMIAHWIITGWPLVLAAPVLGGMLHLPEQAFGVLCLSLLLGTLLMSLIGGFGAVLILGSMRTGVLLALLVLPLYIPVLIFGAGAVSAAVDGMAVQPHMLLLAGMAVMALPLAPLAGAAALRQAAGS